MRIVLVSDFYTVGMGYIENGLTKALAALGHDVHVVASNLNVYGNLDEYDAAYGKFLGPAECICEEFSIDGYTVHRLPHQRVGRYVRINGLISKLRQLSPDIIQVSSAAGVNTFAIALSRGFIKGRLFSGCHQSNSLVQPYLLGGPRFSMKRGLFAITRTLPGWLTAKLTETCYAVTHDCAVNAHQMYGVPKHKVKLVPLGVDTELFRPATTTSEVARRRKTRGEFGFAERDIVCLYTGRLSKVKNPLMIANAIRQLRERGRDYRALFVGEGEQAEPIQASGGSQVIPFTRHHALPSIYQAADLAVWPVQESISMLDAAATGLPLVVPERMAERECVKDNGMSFREGDQDDLIRVLLELKDPAARAALGAIGAKKMREQCSWTRIAELRVHDYENVLSGSVASRPSTASEPAKETPLKSKQTLKKAG